MSNIVKSTVLGLGLVTGVAFGAYAQSSSIAALPPAAPVAPAVAPAASPKYVGPSPGGMWNPSDRQTQAVVPSQKLDGPSPGGMWSTTERQTQPVVPSGQYPGPRPN